nr:hypothetical protein [Pseudoalteromonas luteoviolacea]
MKKYAIYYVSYNPKLELKYSLAAHRQVTVDGIPHLAQSFLTQMAKTQLTMVKQYNELNTSRRAQ